MAIRATLGYGPPGSGKTDAALALAKHIYKTTGKKTRVYCGDGSLANYLDSGLIEAGILEVMDYSAYPWPMTVTNRLAEGWWPAEQGEDGLWRGELVKQSPEQLAKYGLFIFEALSTMIRDYLMGNIQGGMAWQSARGVKIGQDTPYTIKDSLIKSVDAKGNANYELNTGTGEVFGGNPISHFNVAQTHALGVVDRSKALPGWVWWNTHEKLGEEKKTEKQGMDTKTTVTGDIAIGPESAGGAHALVLPRKFNDTLHFTIARKVTSAQDAVTTKSTREVKDEYRIYFRDHFDPDGVVTQVPYKAIVRCAKASKLPPCGYVTGAQGEGVLKLYSLIAEAKRESEAEAKALKAEREVAA